MCRTHVSHACCIRIVLALALATHGTHSPFTFSGLQEMHYGFGSAMLKFLQGRWAMHICANGFTFVKICL